MPTILSVVEMNGNYYLQHIQVNMFNFSQIKPKTVCVLNLNHCSTKAKDKKKMLLSCIITLVNQLGCFEQPCFLSNDGWFSLRGLPLAHCPCVFGLELPEPYLVTGTRPTGLLKMFVGKTQECRAGKSARRWHGNCGVVKGGSDLTCKTNSTLPSFVKCRREVFQGEL